MRNEKRKTKNEKMICLGYKVKVYTVATAATQERKVGSGVYVENNGANIY